MLSLFIIFILLFIIFLYLFLQRWGYAPSINLESVAKGIKSIASLKNPRLIMIDNNKPVKIYYLKNEINVIGRGGNNLINIPDSFVSKQHAVIRYTPNGLIISDLGSKNGTFLNSERILKGGYKILKDGDLIKIGNSEFIIEIPQVKYGEIKVRKVENLIKEKETPLKVTTPLGFLNLANIPIKIIKKIGEGGMAEVYESILNNNTKAALKIIKRSLTGDKEILNRFEREIKINSILNHPNIVKYLGYGIFNSNINGNPKLNGLPCFAMEYINSPTLRFYIKKLNLKQIVIVILYICDALNYAHSKKIIHRDIKPENIFILKNGLVKISDFGIAKIKDFASTVSLGTSIIGTPAYISPEIAIGMDSIDERSDIYSLGVVFYEMVVGRKPFEGNFMTLIYKHAKEDPVPPIQIKPDISEKINNIILKMLKKNRDERYQNVMEIKKDLINFLGEQNVK
ncbi:MAG: protein kinase domain-containing protein [Minisyncoccia bacterium]